MLINDIKIPPALVITISGINTPSSIPFFTIRSVMINQDPMANKKRAIVLGKNVWRAKSPVLSFFLWCICIEETTMRHMNINIAIVLNIYPRLA
jgi:hypothetical protein